jgi:hypothetical protein
VCARETVNGLPEVEQQAVTAARPGAVEWRRRGKAEQVRRGSRRGGCGLRQRCAGRGDGTARRRRRGSTARR